jgi:hypothetical protein
MRHDGLGVELLADRRARGLHAQQTALVNQVDADKVTLEETVAESTMASNTGRVSATELLITRRISADARCCSRASRVSLNRRAFWIAITAWSAKVLSSACSFSLKRSPGLRTTEMEPMPRSSHIMGATRSAKLRPMSCARRRAVGGA